MIWHPLSLKTLGSAMTAGPIKTIFVSLFLTGLLCFVTVSASAVERVVVSTRTIYPGQMIENSDLKIVVVRNPNKVRYAVVRDPYALIGKIAARTILPGRYIPVTASTQKPKLIKAGKPTRVRLLAGSLAITMISLPLSDGSIGQSIRLRNPASGKIFSGIVLEDGSVQVGAL